MAYMCGAYIDRRGDVWDGAKFLTEAPGETIDAQPLNH